MALTNKLTAIANAIRGKTGSTNKLTLDEMPTAISNISSSYEPIIITDSQGVYGLAGASGTYVINKKIPITFNDITKSNQMFYNNQSVDYGGLDITYKNDICTDISEYHLRIFFQVLFAQYERNLPIQSCRDIRSYPTIQIFS